MTFQEKTTTPLTLEAQIGRINAGFSCSPDYTIAAIQGLADTSVLQLLESLEEIRDREYANDVLRNPVYRLKPGCSCFGQLAQKIRSLWYELPDVGDAKVRQLMRLVNVYVTTLETYLRKIHTFDSEFGHHAVYTFFNLRLQDYEQALICRCVPPNERSGISDFRRRTGCTGRMRLDMLFEEANTLAMKLPSEPILIVDSDVDSDAKNSCQNVHVGDLYATPLDMQDIIKLFVLPIAHFYEQDEQDAKPDSAERM